MASSDSQICPHCDCNLAKKALEAHRKLYYDSNSSTWMKKRCLQQQSKPPCEFEEPCPDDFAFDSLSPDDSSCTSCTLELPPPIVGFDPMSSNCNPDAYAEELDEDFNASDTDHLFPESGEDEIEVWNTDSEDSDAPEDLDFEPTEQVLKVNALIQWLLIFILGFQAFYHLTDCAMECLYKFIRAFIVTMGHILSTCAEIGRVFPASLNKARKLFNHKAKFHKYVTCKRCNKIYCMDDCIETLGSRKVAKTCSSTQLARHSRCNTVLLKTVELASKKKIFYPLMTYCYVDIDTALKNLLRQKNFLEKCQQWKLRQVSEDTLSDIYDGNVWKKFEQEGFFDGECSFGLMLNCDWFQPYKHLQYSVGVLYLTVLNLPYSLRNKIENVCLVGILPGPHETPRDINCFIDPLVKDLARFWEGVHLTITASVTRLVKCAVLCVSCDIPAGRKLCGFLGHNARFGCSKCYKVFPGAVGHKDYSGFNREDWPARTEAKHRTDVSRISRCKTVTARNKLEADLGCRYSALLNLPYFDPPVMLAIDPMHNLYLGIAKHHLKRIWMSMGLLNDGQFTQIQERTDKILVTPDIGRIPLKIKSGFSSFTAEQFKNWVNHFSIIVLRDLLPSDHLECWRHFVLASRILCLKNLTTTQVKLADILLLQYCKRVERMYGAGVITPNMHFSCHTGSCVSDYGPTHGFWLFCFERFNGMLGKLPNNNRSIEVQMMKRFLLDTQATSFPHPELFRDKFQSLLSHELTAPESTDRQLPWQVNGWGLDKLYEFLHLPSSYNVGSLSSSLMEQLKSLYSAMYAKPPSDNITLGSHKSRSRTSSIVIAEWNPTLYGKSPGSTIDDAELRPLQVNYFAKHSASIGSHTVTHILVFVNWFKCHPKKDVCGKPVTIWEHDLFEAEHFIPIQLLRFRTVSLREKLSDSEGCVLFVSPLIDQLFSDPYLPLCA